MHIKTEIPGLVRDYDTQAILNTDSEGYRNYKLLRDEKLKTKQLQGEVDSLKNDMVYIKSMLQSISKQQE